MRAVALLTTLHALGVTLTLWGDRLRVDAPQGALTLALRVALREYKQGLHDLVEVWSARAALAEYCGGRSRADAEALAWPYLGAHEALEVSTP